MKIVHSKYIPFGTYTAINLFGIIVIRRGRHLGWTGIHHEMIHSRQQAELLWVGFYLWYLVEWLVRFVILRNTFKAYSQISFEREAYAKQNEIGYLKKRKAYSWRKYLKRS